GHSNRDRSTEDLWRDKKTCPEESLIQIGTMEKSVSPAVLAEIAVEFFEEFERRFGDHIHILDWSLHLDEATPHIHERHVFDVINKYGDRQPKQEEALKELGFELPYPNKKPGKYNNRKITFDAECRRLFNEICKRYGVELEEEPIYGGQKYKEKQEYIIDKLNTDLSKLEKKSRIAEQEYLELQEKISDTERFTKELSEIAYDKACESLVDSIAEGVLKEEVKEINRIKKEILESDNILSKVVSKFAIEQVAKILNSLSAVQARVVKAVKKSFANTTTKEKITKVIAEKAKPSLLEALHKERDDIAMNSKEMSNPVHKKNQDQSL
ncbi:MAG: serine/arginine repetitive matrix protein 2, partial [Lachnospiraceae bacterium]|nr:serine/arginine repetitive matrix protein 2 [Lachnospiraceae bacterium]